MLKDFKKFAMKGSIVDLAIGVIIGGAFGKIVTSLVNDIIMPLIGRLLGKVDFSNFFYAFGEKYDSLVKAQEAGAATLNYGLFINNIINFLIISFSIFLVIRQLERFRKKEEVKVTTKKCTYCLSEIPLEATRCSHCTSILEEK